MFKKIITKLIVFLGSLITTDDTPKIKEDKSKFKNLFRIYFEGYYGHEQINDVAINVSTFEIEKIDFAFGVDPDNKGKRLVRMIVTLGRPGILIGKGGRTIKGLEKYLSDANDTVKIEVIESKLWR